MIYPVKTDFIPLMENLVASLQPFARANFVQLHFSACLEKLEITYHPESILPVLTQLLSRVITFTSQGCEVTLKVQLKEGHVLVKVINTGSPLDHIEEIVTGITQQVKAGRFEKDGTIFELSLPVNDEKLTGRRIEAMGEKKYAVPPFFKKLRESLQSHFTNLENLEKAASARSEAEGVFLKKVNAVIIARLGDEHFNMAALSQAMTLSRSQLYRRLKPLIRQAPAHYIKFVRLQKAKELLDNSDLTAGEVAFKTGFVNQSHFTRAFREQFGFNPSDLKRNKKKEADRKRKRKTT